MNLTTRQYWIILICFSIASRLALCQDEDATSEAPAPPVAELPESQEPVVPDVAEPAPPVENEPTAEVPDEPVENTPTPSPPPSAPVPAPAPGVVVDDIETEGNSNGESDVVVEDDNDSNVADPDTGDEEEVTGGSFPFNTTGIALISILAVLALMAIGGCILHKRNRRRRNLMNGRRLDEIFQIGGPQRGGLPMASAHKPAMRESAESGRSVHTLPSDDQIAREWALNMRESNSSSANLSRTPSVTDRETLLYDAVTDESLAAKFEHHKRVQ